MKKVTVIDYGVGNIFNVSRALQYCGADVILTSDADTLSAAENLILPGVGAFSSGMQGLRERNLIEPILEYVASGKLLLGICLGMQLLFDESMEFGSHKGLGIIQGDVIKMMPKDNESNDLKVPHIGWREINSVDGDDSFNHSIHNQRFYFVHSYMVNPKDENCRLADTYYGTSRISALVRKNNVYGCQFHPEKSGPNGLRFLSSLLGL